jgi:hypothetical protein
MRPHIPHDRPPTIQDPLSDAPTQTYQGHRLAKHDLPARPPTDPANGSNTNANAIASLPVGPATGEISAAPVMRDLRKEAVAFVPRGVKRKKAGQSGVVGSINAAPGGGEIDEDGDEVRKSGVEVGGGLMGKLKGVLATSGVGAAAGKGDVVKSRTAVGGGDDDYQEFLKGLGELG